MLPGVPMDVLPLLIFVGMALCDEFDSSTGIWDWYWSWSCDEYP